MWEGIIASGRREVQISGHSPSLRPKALELPGHCWTLFQPMRPSMRMENGAALLCAAELDLLGRVLAEDKTMHGMNNN